MPYMRCGAPFSALTLAMALSMPLAAMADSSSDVTELRAKIAGMMMVGFRGTSTIGAPDGVNAVRDLGVGGIILFDRDLPSGDGTRNIRSADQVRSLVADMQSLSDDGLIVAIDQEGGLIARLRSDRGFYQQPSAAELGGGPVEETRAIYAETAEMLADLGITINLAPVVDVNVNPDNPIIGQLQRSFGSDPDQVARHAVAAIAGHHDHGVAAAAKHFPGHGSSRDDSHLGFTDVSDTWSQDELTPFRAAIEGGVDTVMTAHVFNRNLDPDWPATLSPTIIRTLLRGDLNYDGVVLSDDMQMRAIAENYDLETAMRQGLNAGIDMFIFANQTVYDPGMIDDAIDIAVDLVLSGAVPRARIDASHERLAPLRDAAR